MPLSELQENIVSATGKVVVKACPGSGKTYSVAARIAHLIKTKVFHHKGIAAISFTNTAWKEINEKLPSFGVNAPISYPHFVGTIDSFLNQYIFLPYGHLVMSCNRRPEIIGEHCHNRLFWEYPRKYAGGFCTYIDPLEHFENVSFNKEDNLVPIKNPQVFNFSWDNIFRKDGSYCKRVQDILDTKNEYIQKGYANQSDANYFTLQVLKTYPQIAKNIINRFPYFIIDEAQDTNDIQMEIINILVENGLQEIMLIGDPNQAIFEWNNANPALFDEKYRNWNPLSLDQNRRSSKNVCNCSNAFIDSEASKPLEGEEITDFAYKPIIRSIKEDSEVKTTIALFLKDCEDQGIEVSNEKVAILYRSKSFKKYFGEEQIEFNDQPWKNGAFHLRDIVQGKYLMELGKFKDGFKLIEQGYFKGTMKVSHVKREDIQKIIDEHGFVMYRKQLFDFINKLPDTERTLFDWLTQVEQIFSEYQIEIAYTKTKSKVPITSLFSIFEEQNLPYYHGTIHSAKGCTFEAVLVLLSERASNSGTYRNLFKDKYENVESNRQEELRIVYVALTRPRKVLNIGVPVVDLELWEDKLNLSKKPVQLTLFG